MASMSHTFTRQSLYELAWSEPLQSLSKKLAISDRGLAKVCAAANIPVPSRGYWAKKQAGKPVSPMPLPPRALGQSDFVHIGRDWYRSDSDDTEILSTPIPPAPVFTTDMDAVWAQAAILVAKAPLPLRDSHGWHSQIQKLLNADEERAKKQRADPYPSTWNAPLFDGPFEVRRLRIPNALFICLTRCGMSPHVGDKYGRELSITVGTTNVPLVLDSTAATKQIERERQGYGFMARGPRTRCVSASRTAGPARSWDLHGRTSRASHWSAGCARSRRQSSCLQSRPCATAPCPPTRGGSSAKPISRRLNASAEPRRSAAGWSASRKRRGDRKSVV
jgi:hypothetical protein